MRCVFFIDLVQTSLLILRVKYVLLLIHVILRLLRTFAGVLREKIRMRAILKENMTNYISLERLINVDFRKI